jgi:integrase
MGRRPNPTVTPYHCADGSTTYRVRIRVGGRHTTETFDSPAAAQVFALRCADPAIGPERAVAMRAREDRVSDQYVPTLREMLPIHLAELSGVEPRTLRDYQAVADRTWLKPLGSLRVDELERADVATWVNKAAGTMAPKSVKNAHSILSAVLETAVQKGYASTNPARRMRLPRTGEESRTEARFLTYAEFDRLWTATPEHYRPFIVTLFGTGLRFSEATALQVRDVDQAQGTLRVVRAWKDRPPVIGPPKSTASRRTIALPNEVVEAVRPLLDRPGDAWLFTTRSGGPVRHNNFYSRVWVPACQAAGLAPRPRIHDARHTHASWLIARGVRLEVVQERLGHEDYTTTRKVYAHLTPDMVNSGARAAEQAFANTVIRSLPAPT